MSDLMNLLDDLQYAEERRKRRYERTTKISELIDCFRSAFQAIQGRIDAIESDDGNIAKQFRTQSSDDFSRLKREVTEDTQDLLNDLRPLHDILCPAKELLERHETWLKQRLPQAVSEKDIK